MLCHHGGFEASTYQRDCQKLGVQDSSKHQHSWGRDVNHVWSMPQELPKDAHRESEGQQQRRGLVVGQIEAQNIDDLHSLAKEKCSYC